MERRAAISTLGARLGRAAALAGAALLPAAAQDAQPPVVRSGVELVLVDVQVVDRSGRPITSLGPEDFEVTLDRRPRRVVSADLVRPGSAAMPGPAAGRPSLPGGGVSAAEGRRFILAIDEHSFRAASARAAMHAAGRFVDRLQPGDLVGLYTYPTGAAHWPLTDDHEAVRRALDGVTGLLDLPMTRYDLSRSEVIDISSGDMDALNRAARRSCGPRDVSCRRELRDEAISLAGYFEMQVTQSLGGLRPLFDGLSKLEGRKTLVIVSGGLLTSDRANGRVNMAAEIQQAGRDAAASNTNIYVLHMDASFLDAFSDRGGPSPTLMRDSGALAAGLERIADTAGGALIRVEAGTGDTAFERVLRENSAYYLLGVEPAPEDRDGEAHAIRVRVRLRGVTVRSRAQAIVPR